MKIKYNRPITDDNIEAVSLEIEKGLDKVRQAKTLDYIASPITLIFNIICLPVIAILIIQSTSFKALAEPLADITAFSWLVDIADNISISMLGTPVHPALAMAAIAILAPVIICWPITFIVSRFIAHKCVSPLEGEVNKVIKANIINDQVEKLRFARAEGTKTLLNTIAIALSLLLYAVYILYVIKNFPDILKDDSSLTFIAILSGLGYALVCYAIVSLSKGIVSRLCMLNPIYYVKELKKDALAYKVSVHLPSIVKNAVRDDSYFINYQPVYWVREDCFASAEALCRLNNPIFGLIPPDLFIRCAEDTDQIGEVTNLIIHKVCRFMLNSQCASLGIKYININLSVMDIVKRGRVDHIVSIVDSYGIPHHEIGFEITETVSESSAEEFWNNINYLANSGFTISMDDFGTGYNSLSRMISDAFSVVKIDRSLIASKNDKNKRTLLLDIVNMLKHLNKQIVMEGVESKEQVDLIKELGIEQIQGFFYSKPLDETTFMDFIRATREAHYGNQYSNQYEFPTK